MRFGVFAVLAVIACCSSARADEDYKWILDHDSDGASLTYMVPDSDAVEVTLSCSKKKQTGNYSEYETDTKLDGKKKASVTLTVNGKSFKYKGSLTPNEEAGTPGFDADISLKDAFWTEMKSAKEFDVNISGVKDSHTLKGANVTGMLKACAK